jgi:lactate dehydrogenase-like 2-hydroxyacid dehydrogenase
MGPSTHTPSMKLQAHQKVVKNVYYYPDPSASIPNEELAEVEAIFSHPFTGIYSCIKSIDQLPKLRYVQNSATGVDRLL